MGCRHAVILMLLAGTVLAAADAGKVREPTAAEIAKLVQAAAAAKPDWWDATVLNHPPTLDLSCPRVKGWQPKVAPGAWHFDVVHPNPRRWKEGTKFWHLVLTNAQEKKLPDAERSAVRQLAECYGDLLNDWPRALHWYAEVGRFDAGNPEIIVSTAYAYWRLGSRTLAVQTLKPLDQDATRHGSLIKLWADLGEYATAARLAEAKAKSAEDIGWYMAGYVAQLEGAWKKALDCYQRAAGADQGRSGRDWKQTRQRAASAIAAISLFEALDLRKVADGTYADSSSGYVGPVAVAVTVAAGRIQAVQVKQHKENRFLTALEDIPARIIARQHVKGVDAVLGATLTSEAIVYATAKALKQGQRP